MVNVVGTQRVQIVARKIRIIRTLYIFYEIICKLLEAEIPQLNQYNFVSSSTMIFFFAVPLHYSVECACVTHAA